MELRIPGATAAAGLLAPVGTSGPTPLSCWFRGFCGHAVQYATAAPRRWTSAPNDFRKFRAAGVCRRDGLSAAATPPEPNPEWDNRLTTFDGA